LTECTQCGNRVTDQQEFCSKCGRKLGAIEPKQKAGFKWKYVFFAFIALWILTLFNKREPTSASTPDVSSVASTVSPPLVHHTTNQDLTLNFTWSKEGFDNIMQANFTVKNDGPDAVKDIEITCVHTAPSGTVIDKNTRTIYEIVKAKAKRSFPKFNMGFINSQVKSSYCQIVGFKLID